MELFDVHAASGAHRAPGLTPCILLRFEGTLQLFMGSTKRKRHSHETSDHLTSYNDTMSPRIQENDFLLHDTWESVFTSIPSFPVPIVNLVVAYVLSSFARPHSTQFCEWSPSSPNAEFHCDLAIHLSGSGEGELLAIQRDEIRSLMFDSSSQMFYQLHKRRLPNLQALYFIQAVKLYSHYLHILWFSGSRYVRSVYSLPTCDFLQEWRFPFNDQYENFCLDREGREIIYRKWCVSLSNKNFCVLEKVKSYSNETIQTKCSSVDWASRLILFETDGNGSLYILSKNTTTASTKVECFDTKTLDPKMNIEIPLPIVSAIFIDDYFFFRAHKDVKLYKYDVLNKKTTIHCQNFPHWNHLDSPLFAWHDCLVLAESQRLYLFK